MLIDISLPIREGMIVYEGDPDISLRPALSMKRGDPANVSRMDLGSHTGTHMDAPLHFIDGAGGIDTVALDTLIGPALVAEVVAERTIDAAHVSALPLAGQTRVIFKTRNSALWDRPGFSRDYVSLSLDAAKMLIERGVKLIGIDYLSIEGFDAVGHPVHKALLGAGVVILEGLDLRRVTPGVYELYCLPLRIAGGDGSPCRAVLRG
jgi:arylformamidase